MTKKTNLLLGKETKYNLNQPDQKILCGVENPHQDCDYSIKLSCPEFTSICPITGQPDFAHLIIDYLPNKKIKNSFLVFWKKFIGKNNNFIISTATNAANAEEKLKIFKFDIFIFFNFFWCFFIILVIITFKN